MWDRFCFAKHEAGSLFYVCCPPKAPIGDLFSTTLALARDEKKKRRNSETTLLPRVVTSLRPLFQVLTLLTEPCSSKFTLRP